ncbi:MAG: transcriptional repressor [Phycisphaerae bacterium]|nr:transcriptional repressor [Phycisphaerae bacterium]
MDLRPIEHEPVGAGSEEGGAELSIVEPLCAVFRRKLRSEGLKYTPERARILDAIIRRDDVFEAESIIDAFRNGTGGSGRARASKATVYRTIKLLEEAGIVQRVPLDTDQSFYQVAYGRRTSGVIVRLDTRAVVTLEVPELAGIRDRICRERGLVPEGHRLVIYARQA